MLSISQEIIISVILILNYSNGHVKIAFRRKGNISSNPFIFLHGIPPYNLCKKLLIVRENDQKGVVFQRKYSEVHKDNRIYRTFWS